MSETEIKQIKISHFNWEFMRALKVIQGKTFDDVLDDMIDFYVRCREP